LRILNGIKTTNITNLSISADESGITSFEGCPDKIGYLSVCSCEKLSNFAGFPKKITSLSISIFKGCLLFLHEKIQNGEIDNIIFILRNSNQTQIDLMTAIKKLSDPFEFQDWCIENDYEEFL
jgi:hypothetical protein